MFLLLVSLGKQSCKAQERSEFQHFAGGDVAFRILPEVMLPEVMSHSAYCWN